MNSKIFFFIISMRNVTHDFIISQILTTEQIRIEGIEK